jgi:hypothetical protein
MKITIELDDNEVEALRQMCEGQLMMAGFCEMADDNPLEQAKYEVC